VFLFLGCGALSEQVFGAVSLENDSNSNENIASGSYGDTTWVIDANGKLTVEGIGEVAEHKSLFGHRTMPWFIYHKFIISAEITVTGMKDASFLFYGCENITSIDVTNFDTSKVTDMDYMFYDCESLTTLDVSNFDTSNVTDGHGIYVLRLQRPYDIGRKQL
jgi:surface protein